MSPKRNSTHLIDVFGYTIPRLHEGKKWYVDFYAIDPSTGEARRKKFYVPKSVVDIDAIIPGGIMCLYSAWSYYNLTTQVPDAFYVAVGRSRKIKLPTFPDIKLVFQRNELLEIGKVEIEEQGLKVLMTDLERSVCDAVKYRNKIGIDVMTEIIDNYLRRTDRNLSRLTESAKKLRVYSTLYQILQVKL